MENALPSLLIGAIMLVAASFFANSTFRSYDQLGASLKASEARMGERTTTRLTITSASLNGARDTLTVNLHNDGQTRLGTYGKLDVIVTYYTSATDRMTSWFPFADAVTASAWTLVAIADDTYEPGILNPGETAQMEIDLGGVVQPGKTNLIVISSEAGSTVSATFTS
jgi:archaellum component FlaF (FlaF/FlaG flagellin family)